MGSGAPTMRAAVMGSDSGASITPTENLPNAGVDTGPKPAKQVAGPAGKPRAKKITSIDETTSNLSKVKNDQLVKPMQNNMDLSRQANSLLANIGNSLDQSVAIQTEMLNALKRIENASPKQIDADGNVIEPAQASSSQGTIGDSVRNKSTLPEPTISLKRKENISA